ncbi:MAG TPA: ABC transporter permease [Methanoregulaceae archaeon]|jgi:tungstate transport system permease protein|nr:ABC transporter permease [Methanoregulaceae archaeon]MDD3090037.1 ABC transporter permease [Methanoregulaceae archaeon]MDD5048363.1 ABC transporter permease [Methanoregulaceae archaeon]MDD5684227.1 ABC transporter permease [Methanoregulaceae archaeon]HOP67015.1 ABC transporter permease [Methanoregulaceae archaeon]
MNDIIEGFTQAFQLIVTLNPEVMGITIRSLFISLSATFLASIIAIPLGGLIHFREFGGKKGLITIIQALYALPTVLAGLFVFLLISRSGPFGFLGLMFTPTGMIFGQMVLIIPLMIGMTLIALSGVRKNIQDTIVSLGADEFQSILTIIKEARFAILGGVILGFGRAISEVGAAMIIGGNIRGYTRILTTAIALETSQGNLPLSIALGLILLFIALIVTTILFLVQER